MEWGVAEDVDESVLYACGLVRRENRVLLRKGVLGRVREQNSR